MEVRCRVALRQLGEMFPDGVISAGKEERRLGAILAHKLSVLSALLNCDVAELRLDHDPALATRMRRTVGETVLYSPDANDPSHLAYRPHGPQHAGSHLIKTNVRGDHGQYPDRVLIKRERKRVAKKVKKRRHKWRSRPLRSGSRFPKGRKIASRRKER